MTRFLSLRVLVTLLAVQIFATASAQDGIPSLEDAIGQSAASGSLGDVGDFGGFGGFGAATEELTLTAELTLATGQRSGTLSVTATLAPNWHTYAMDQEGGPGPTRLSVAPEDQLELLGPFRPDHEPEQRTVEFFEVPLREHYDKVVWTAPIRLASGVDPEQAQLQLIFDGQICEDNVGCRPIFGRQVDIVFGGYSDSVDATPIATDEAVEPDAVEPTVDNSSDTAPAPLEFQTVESVANAEDGYSFLWIILIAMVGGLILNIMPCVLPVIGLKVLSFVQQGGDDPRRVFFLNVWYSLGLISVFLVLATLTVVLNMGWGAQFQYDGFNIPMAAVVFAMGLSFLGVWEIPIPGFVGGSQANKLAAKEGPAGAFLKGVITTLLATPCSGPFLGTALAWAAGKSPLQVYTVFGALGLGMASPYLLLGMNPGLAKHIPKPGAWMDTFKQILGFVLMGTVVYLLTFVRWVNVLPTLATLFGIWAALWWVGRTSPTAPLQMRLRAWLVATSFAILIGFGAFFTGKVEIAGTTVTGLRGVMEHRYEKLEQRLQQDALATDPLDAPDLTEHVAEIRWVPYTEGRLTRLLQEDRTVLIDFTADWCLTCKTLESTVLDTQPVRDVMRENGVVALIADWTRGDAEVTRMLERLGSLQVPQVAIFSPENAQQPIVLRGGYSRSTLIQKLQEAKASAEPSTAHVPPASTLR